MSRHKRRSRAGFTLLEVLLVIGILALLAAFVVPALSGAGERARIGIAQSEIGRNGPIAGALKRYKWDIGKFPDTDEGLAALFERPSSVDEESKKWNGPYVEGSPEDLKDPWGKPFQYRFPGDANEKEYDLWSFGPDMKDSTDDDITSWKRK
jgi:general secretion pathway protein G